MFDAKHLNAKDVAAGATFVIFGVFFGATTLRTLDVGTAQSMGPGYFPLMLATALILLGVGTVARGFFAARSPFGVFPWRAVLMISLSPIVFGATVRGLGLFLAVVLSSFVAAFASAGMTFKRAAAVSLSLAVFCAAIFSYGLRLPLPIFGPWIPLG